MEMALIIGESWQEWLQTGKITRPGGGAPVTAGILREGLIPLTFSTLSGTEIPAAASAATAVPGSDAMGRQWLAAQAAEREFWKNWRANQLYGDLQLGEYWRDVLSKTGGPLEAGWTLDIGCGPVSVLNFHRAPGLVPLGLDPLARFYRDQNLVECRPGWTSIAMLDRRGEELPFAGGALDQVICFNVLDHVAHASGMLGEMRRVLRPGGQARVFVHTFRPWVRKLLFFDKPHVYHWDHAEFRAMLGRAGFVIDRELRERKVFDVKGGWRGRLRRLPYVVASYVTYTSYFLLTRPEGGN